MKTTLTFITTGAIICFLFSCGSNKAPKDKDLEVVNYEQLSQYIKQKDDVLYVVNFWATWCQPCVEELPEFMEVNNEFAQRKNFEMVLVSLDNARNVESHVKPFLAENKIPVKCFVLDDIKKMNEWIPATNSSWTGAIPATVFYKNKDSKFFIEGQLSKEKLKQEILQNL